MTLRPFTREEANRGVRIELFSCAGGMAEGFRRSGLPFDLAVDADPVHCDSYERNLGHRPICVDARDLLRWIATLRPMLRTELVVADPPCTPWSRAGKRLGTKDERDMLGVTIELLQVLRPTAWMIANVPGLDDGPNWERVVQPVIGGFAQAAGYCVDFARLDAADYGWVELCPEHARCAGRLSAPTTVQGTADCIRRRGARSPTERAFLAAAALAKATRPATAADVTLDEWVRSTDPSLLASATANGKADASSTIEDMCECGLAVATNESTGSSRLRCSVDHLALERSYITAMRIRRTTNPATSACSPQTETTCVSTSVVESEVRACAGCRWWATPQHRVRPFWFGHRWGTPCIAWPELTHGDPALLAPTLPGVRALRPWVTCRDALGHLPPEEIGRPMRTRSTAKHPAATPDEPAFTITAGGSRQQCNHLEWPWDRPATTVYAGTCQPGKGSPMSRIAPEWPWDRPATVVCTRDVLGAPGDHGPGNAQRGPGAIALSVRAATILQGFPESWVFAGKSKAAQWRQIGQAMPPPLAEAVARAVAAQMASAARAEVAP